MATLAVTIPMKGVNDAIDSIIYETFKNIFVCDWRTLNSPAL